MTHAGGRHQPQRGAEARHDGGDAPAPVMGGLEDVADLVKQNDISRIYVALPMASQPRILKLLDDLRDTTASIYFVPDLFIFDHPRNLRMVS